MREEVYGAVAGTEPPEGRAWRVQPRVIVGVDRQRASGLRQALMAAGLEVAPGLTVEDVLRYAVEGRGDLVLVSGSFRGVTPERLDELRALGLPVVVMARDDDSARYMGRGYVVLPDRLPPEQVAEAVLAVLEGRMEPSPAAAAPVMPAVPEEEGEEGKGRLVTVCGLKGGSGKTTLVLSLAYAIGRAGRRACALSLDPVASDFQAYLGLDVGDGIAVAVGSSEMEQAVARELRAVAKGCDVLCGPFRPIGMRAVTAELARRVVALLRRRYDVVLVDAGNYPTEHPAAGWAMEAADQLLVVITPEFVSIYRAHVSMERLQELRRGRWTGIVMCRYRRGRHHWTEHEVRDELGLPIVGVVPDDEKGAARALDRQAPLVAVGGRAAAAIEKLARQLLAVEVAAR